jgi:hypothetical protein
MKEQDYMSEVNETVAVEMVEQEKAETRGDRGEVGQATAGLTIKQRWHASAFKRVNAEDKHNSRKRVYVRISGAPSLKQYVRALMKSGDQTAKDWRAHKKGSLNQKRSDANIKAATECRTATKQAKRKVKASAK